MDSCSTSEDVSQALLPLRLWSLRFQLLLLRVCVSFSVILSHLFVLDTHENNLQRDCFGA